MFDSFIHSFIHFLFQTVTYLFQFLLPMSAILICGHIGETELDSVGKHDQSNIEYY